MPYITVNIPSVTGNLINAWLYEPSTPGPHAVLVMGAGIALVKSGGLPPFAEAFQAEGYAAVTFDYLSFGSSEGTPRNVLSLSQELQDFRDVISWVRGNSAFDNEKIVAWGSSLGAMHPTALIAEDHGLAAANTGKSKLALLSAPDVPEGWARLMPEDNSPFFNQVSARGLLSVLVHRPGLHIGRSIKPYLAVCTEYDTVASLGAAEKAARNAPLGELVKLKGGHFDVYKGGVSYEENVKAQLEFLKRVVPLSQA